MPAQDPRVPSEVEEYLIGRFAAAGQLGGRLGGSLAGARGRAGARGGARGGAIGARRLKTVVEERVGERPGTADELRRRVTEAVPELQTLSDHAGTWRITVPLGRTGLQEVVVDLMLAPVADTESPITSVQLRAFCKEGLLSRKPTAKTAERVWTALEG